MHLTNFFEEIRVKIRFKMLKHVNKMKSGSGTVLKTLVPDKYLFSASAFQRIFWSVVPVTLVN